MAKRIRHLNWTLILMAALAITLVPGCPGGKQKGDAPPAEQGLEAGPPGGAHQSSGGLSDEEMEEPTPTEGKGLKSHTEVKETTYKAEQERDATQPPDAQATEPVNIEFDPLKALQQLFGSDHTEDD